MNQMQGGRMMMQRPGMSQLEQRLQPQQTQPMMMRPMTMQQSHPRMQVGPGGPMPRVPPPNYMQAPAQGPGMPGSSPMQPQGPSPVPSYQGASPGQLAQPSPGGMMSNSMNPSPSSNLNTPLAAPASQEDREYFEKVKSLEKYIEPLRNMT